MALMAGCGPSQPAASLLCQLLLKAASNDKRFVVEEAQRALSLISTKVLVLFLLCIQLSCNPLHGLEPQHGWGLPQTIPVQCV